jgi:hypothetical protein
VEVAEIEKVEAIANSSFQLIEEIAHATIKEATSS